MPVGGRYLAAELPRQGADGMAAHSGPTHSADSNRRTGPPHTPVGLLPTVTLRPARSAGVRVSGTSGKANNVLFSSRATRPIACAHFSLCPFAASVAADSVDGGG
jgi:hypothetical protein